MDSDHSQPVSKLLRSLRLRTTLLPSSLSISISEISCKMFTIALQHRVRVGVVLKVINHVEHFRPRSLGVVSSCISDIVHPEFIVARDSRYMVHPDEKSSQFPWSAADFWWRRSKNALTVRDSYGSGSQARTDQRITGEAYKMADVIRKKMRKMDYNTICSQSRKQNITLDQSST